MKSDDHLQLDFDQIEENMDSISDNKVDVSLSSEHDIWRFMCRVFKNNLTKKEVSFYYTV